jgi:hypothetical protein
MLAVPKQLSLVFNKHHSVAPTPKNWAALFSQGASFACKQNFAISHLRDFLPYEQGLFFLSTPFSLFQFSPTASTNYPRYTTMFSRAVRISRAAPIRAAVNRAQAASIVAWRTVTTNAASAQVDKSTVPQVSLGGTCGVFFRMCCHSCRGGLRVLFGGCDVLAHCIRFLQ